MDVLSMVREQKDRLVALRRDIHQYPELGWQEVRTHDVLLGELTKLGIPSETVCDTGLIATLQGDLPGPVIGLRADMDALPIQEKNDVPYRSQIDGIMHACGHDCNSAMLLGAARALSACRDELRGTVKFIFQPAEEIIEGGKRLSQLPQLANLDRILGVHVCMDLNVGEISAEPGPRMACADNIYFTIHGKSSHGAQPQQAVDAIVAACAVVEQLQTVVSRRVNPLEPVVVSIGTIQGGTAANIIANEVQLSGTVRCFSPTLRVQLPGLLEHIIRSTAEAHGATCEFEYRACTPPTINDDSTTAIARRAVEQIFGAAALVHLEKTTGGEDFAWYLQNTTGTYLFVGCRNEAAGKSSPQHHECFDIDEMALVYGAAALTQFALEDSAKE